MAAFLTCLTTKSLNHERRLYSSPHQGVRESRMRCFELSKRCGLLAALVVADGARVADAFGGMEFRVAVTPYGSRGKGSFRRNSGKCERRTLLWPHLAIRMPTSVADEEQLESEETSTSTKVEVKTLRRNIRGVKKEGTVVGERTNRVPDQNRRVKARIGHETRKVEPPRPPVKLGSFDDTRVMSFGELNSYKVDPRFVRHSVGHYLKRPKELTRSNYLCLAMASGRFCDIHLVTHICETARSVGIETSVHFMTNVINAATQNSRWLMAVQLLQLMRGYGVSPNEITYTSILSRMSKAKQHYLCTEMMMTEGLEKNLDAHNALISGCAANRSYDRAMSYFHKMKEAGVKPDAMTFSSLIATTRDTSHEGVERAFDIIELMRREEREVTTECMNALMGVCVQAREPNTALQVFKSMDAEGIPKDLVSYNTAIAACDKLRDGGAAVQLLVEAGHKSLPLDMCSYNSVMSALGHSNMCEEALVLFEEMARKGLKRDLVTFNTMISSCVRANKPEKALEVFGQMADEGIGRDQYSYAGALHACLKLADWELSLELLLQMEKMGMAANPFSYATAIRTCARCGQSDVAAHMYAQSLRLGVVPNEVTFLALLEAFAAEKLSSKAVWVLEEMAEMGVPITPGHLRRILAACTNEVDIALRVLRLHREQGFEIHQELFEGVLQVCRQADDAEATELVMDSVKRAGMTLRSGGQGGVMREFFTFTNRYQFDHEDENDLLGDPESR